jgi:hypothetical protein
MGTQKAFHLKNEGSNRVKASMKPLQLHDGSDNNIVVSHPLLTKSPLQTKNQIQQYSNAKEASDVARRTIFKRKKPSGNNPAHNLSANNITPGN